MRGAKSSGRLLTPEQASRVYDRIGRLQDWQIYESQAIREQIRLGSFGTARSLFEFGCGTGAFAAKLLKTSLRRDCRYVGIDVSRTMVRLAASRLTPWSERATIRLSDGSSCLNEADNTFDRFVSNYVFDLLPGEYALAIIAEAHRVLCNNGKLCVVSLGYATSGFSRIVTGLWDRAWRCKPEIVGGCRPVNLRRLLDAQWSIEHYTKVVSFGISSDVLVASRRPD